MIEKNKIISLTVIGLVVGAVLGMVINSEQVDAYMLAVFGGVIGFLAGWIWNSRAGDAGSGDDSEGHTSSSEG